MSSVYGNSMRLREEQEYVLQVEELFRTFEMEVLYVSQTVEEEEEKKNVLQKGVVGGFECC